MRGICALCRRGTFEEVTGLLFRVYSGARRGSMISRSELAMILDRHVVLDGFEVSMRSGESI